MRSDIPIYSRRLRPLVPSPLTPSNSAFSSISLHNRIIPSWNQPLFVGGVSGYGSGRREIRMMSSRWNPTPEQLQALEEMYRRGTKTPSSDQIQHIAAKLRRFGKIEGKNVFYWFQNHKARDRQRKRRQIESLPPNNFNDAHLPKPSGLSSVCLETEHPKKLPTKSNCSTASKNSGSMRGEVVQQRTKHELQHNFTNEKATGQENAHSLVTLNLCKLLPPKNDHYFQSEIKEDQTLELFPITSSNLSTVRVVKDEIGYDGSSLGTRLVPNQFFEFLPTKN